MGCCLSCLKGYRQIPNQGNQGVGLNYINGSINGYQYFPQPSNGPIDSGTMVNLKYTNRHNYSPRFIWINRSTLTINMSKHTKKERSHKEANLLDLTSVIAGPPQFYKPIDDNGPDTIDGKLCLTINFSKGGGIDILFANEEDRNIWFVELNNIVLRQGHSLSAA